jgi:hypothetical protein
MEKAKDRLVRMDAAQFYQTLGCGSQKVQHAQCWVGFGLKLRTRSATDSRSGNERFKLVEPACKVRALCANCV